MATYTGKKHFGGKLIYTGIGISVGSLNYYGDLSPLPTKFSTDFKLTKPAFGISLFRRLGPRYSLMAQFMYGTLEGSDATSAKKDNLSNGIFRYDRNLSFRNRIKELSVTAVFDLFKNDETFRKRVWWTPYVFAGVAVFAHNPMAKEPATFLDGTSNPNAGKWIALQPLGTEGQYSKLKPGDVNYGIKPYSLIQVAIPIGVGARFRINDVLDLWADIGFRYTFTDYLDDVSKNYVDLNSLQAKNKNDNKLAQAMAYRSNEVMGNPTAATSSAHDYPATEHSGEFYTWAGYGSEGKDNIRGHANNRDMYVVSSIKITYILKPSYFGSKRRQRK